tara:strand:+ start:909 stop:2099 length:1191 start_codon:yes stop_codon:yes gene_type:complete
MEILEILKNLFISPDGVSLGIAPFLLSALTSLPKTISAMGSATDMERQGRIGESRGKADRRRGAAMLESLRKGELEFAPQRQKVSKYYTDAYEDTLSRAPEAAAAEAREQALATGATGTMDPRVRMAITSGSGLAGVEARADALAGLSTRTGMAKSLGAAEQTASQANTSAFNTQMQKEVLRAQGIENTGRAGARKGRDDQRLGKTARRQALMGFAMKTGVGALTSALGKNVDIPGTKSLEQAGLGDVDTSFLDKYTGPNYDMTANALGGVDSPFGSGGLQGGSLGGYSQGSLNSGGLTALQRMQAQLPSGFEDGGKLSYREGGEVMETEGEFDHDTNKKAVIDQEDGTKEAELTGGELIFNPDQTGVMEELVNRDDSKGLLSFLKKLLSKDRFKG